MEHNDYLGVPADAVHSLGATVLGAGRLELSVRAVAADLYEYPGKVRTSDLVKHIRRCGVAKAIPSHSSIEGTHLVRWADATRGALGERDRALHSASAHTMGGPHLIHLRTGDRTPIDAQSLDALARALSQLSEEGNSIVQALRQSPRLGVFLANTVVDEQWTPICNTDLGGADMARPTDAELDEWWAALGPFPSLSPNGPSVSQPSEGQVGA